MTLVPERRLIPPYPMKTNLTLRYLSHVHFKGIQIASTPPAAQIRDPFPPAIEAIAKGICDLKPLVTHTTSLRDYPSLMQQILSGDPDYIKGVIRLEA